MTETYIKNTTNNSGTTAVRGELTFEDKVIEKIVGIAIEHVDGLLAVNGGFFSNLKNSVVNSDSVTDGVNVEVGKSKLLLIWILLLNTKNMFQLSLPISKKLLKLK